MAIAQKKGSHEKGLVSVIMPTYNSGRFVAESIESILNQTYTHLELLITDDGSTDDTPKLSALTNKKTRASDILPCPTTWGRDTHATFP